MKCRREFWINLQQIFVPEDEQIHRATKLFYKLNSCCRWIGWSCYRKDTIDIEAITPSICLFWRRRFNVVFFCIRWNGSLKIKTHRRAKCASFEQSASAYCRQRLPWVEYRCAQQKRRSSLWEPFAFLEYCKKTIKTSRYWIFDSIRDFWRYLWTEFILEGCKLASGVAFALCSGVEEVILEMLDKTSKKISKDHEIKGSMRNN